MFERPDSGERAVLVHMEMGREANREELGEFRTLVSSAGVEEVAVVTGARQVPDARYFIGSGKAQEVVDALVVGEGDLVIFNHSLSPSQERNLEKVFNCRVVDRTGLILDIFAQRARTFEGKLQVELAQLKHLSTRLIRGWTHLERQKGGIGLRGPGETQLETDRRLLGLRIKQLNKRLARINRQRDQGRRSRTKAEVPTVSLVGYTNAGKSTLFNSLTEAGVYAADQLFATLDPTLRRLALDNGQQVVLADTVGFIRHLPHDLVVAFRSTLQETVEADLLLHVIDAHHPERDDTVDQVNGVLREIGAEDVPQIEVYNKIDLMPDTTPRLERDEFGRITRVWVSAASGEGLDLLAKAIAESACDETVTHWLNLPMTAGRLRAKLFDLGQVLNDQVDEQGQWRMQVRMGRHKFEYLQKQEGLSGDWVQ